MSSMASQRSSRSCEVRRGNRSHRSLRCETLERRELLAAEILSGFPSHESSLDAIATSQEAPPAGESVLTVRLDDSLDTSDFFTRFPDAKQIIQEVADSIVSRFDDTLTALTPPTRNEITWQPAVHNPSTGNITALSPTYSVAANELVVFIGGRDLSGNERGHGGFNQFQTNFDCRQSVDGAACTTVGQTFVNSVASRGQAGALTNDPTDFAPSVSFLEIDSRDETKWHFGSPGTGASDETDFRAVVAHELAHGFGFGTAPSWAALVTANGTGATFDGIETNRLYPDTDNAPLVITNFTQPPSVVGLRYQHFAEEVQTNFPAGTGMGASVTGLLTEIDFAALNDIGWDVNARAVPSVQLFTSSFNASEDVRDIELTATLSETASTAVRIPLRFTGSAQQADYTIADSEILIPAGQLSGSTTLTIVNDDIREPNLETIIVSLLDTDDVDLGTTSSRTITIAPSDLPLNVNLATNQTTVSEGVTNIELTAILSENASEALSIPVQFTGTAQTSDFTSSSNEIVIETGQRTGTLLLAIVNDEIEELNPETIVISLQATDDVNLGAVPSQTITIAPSDFPPTVNLAVSDNQVLEGDEAITVTANLSEAAASALTIPLGFTGSAQPSDYTTQANEIVIAAGQTSGSISLSVIDDEIEEPAVETIVVSVQESFDYLLGASASQTIAIGPGDVPPIVQLSANVNQVAEESDDVILTATLSENARQEITIPIRFSGTAQGIDYISSANQIVIPAGQRTGSSVINIVNDELEEQTQETIIVTLQDTFQIQLSNAISQTITIVPSDLPPTAMLTTSATNVNEASGNISLSVSLTEPAARQFVFPLDISGTAQASDFDLEFDQIIVAAGQQSGSVQLTIVDDTIEESTPETIVVSIQDIAGINLGGSRTQTITIAPSDTIPTASFSQSLVIVSESVGTVDLVVNLTSPAQSNLSIPIAVDGTVQSGDFELTNNQIDIAAGQSTGTLRVGIVDDAIPENIESLVLTMQPTAGLTLGDPASQTVRIAINDQDNVGVLPTVQFSASQVTSVAENIGVINLQVSLSEAADEAITVPVAVSGTVEPSDYQITSLSVEIPAGQTTATLPISIVNDSAEEMAESLTLTLQTPTGNAILGANLSQTITIQANDIVGTTTSRILAPEVVARPHYIPGDGRPTAILLSARSATRLSVSLAVGESHNNSISMLNRQLEPIGGVDNDGKFQANLAPGGLYALIFSASNRDAFFNIVSSAGYDSVFNPAQTNLLQPTDVNASGESTALDALQIINELNRDPASGEAIANAPLFMDVNGDGRISATDALAVINQLNENVTSAGEAVPALNPNGESMIDLFYRRDEVESATMLDIESTITKIVGASSQASASEAPTESGPIQSDITSEETDKTTTDSLELLDRASS